MPIRTKLLAYSLGIALLVPIVGIVAVSRVRAIYGNVHELSGNIIPDLLTLKNLKQLQTEQDLAALAYIADGKDEDQQRYIQIGQAIDEKLQGVYAEQGKSGTSEEERALIDRLADQRTKFQTAGTELMAARTTVNRNISYLNSRYEEISRELSSVRRRFVPSGQNPTDPASIPVNLRYQVNDLLAAGEGMLHNVALQWALATDSSITRDDALRTQFETATNNFQTWMALATTAAGPDDKVILGRASTKFDEFESAARAMITTGNLFSKSRTSFSETSTGFRDALDGITALEVHDAKEAEDSSLSSANSSQVLIISVAIAAFALAGLAGMWFAGMITRPIVHLRDVAERISMGDTGDIEVNVDSQDEIGELAASFRRMMISLRILKARSQQGGSAAGEGGQRIAS